MHRPIILISDYQTGMAYRAASNLTSGEVLKVANAAKKANFYDGYVTWCQAALKAAKAEAKPPKTINMIK